MSAAPTPQPDQDFQYIKLPDGSYGKFRSDVDDATIKAQISKDYPDAYKDAPKPPSTMQKIGQVAGGVGTGVIKGVGNTVGGVSSLINKIPFVGEDLAPKQGVAALESATRPVGPAEKTGYYGEQAGEFLIPGPAEGKAGLTVAKYLPKLGKAAPAIGRIGAQVISNAALNKVQGGSAEAGALGGLGGGILGEGLKAAAPAIAESALGITKKMRGYGKTPGAAVLDEISGVRPSSILKNATAKTSALSNELENMAAAHPGLINMRPAIDVVDSAKAKAASRNYAIPALDDVKNQLTKRTGSGIPIASDQSATNALALKRGLRENFVTNWNPEVHAAVPGVAKKASRAIDTGLDTALGPQFGELNQRVSSLIPVTERAESIGRGAPIPQRVIHRVGAHTGALLGAGVGAGAGYREGGIPGAIGGGILGAVAPEAAVSPITQMVVARGLRSGIPIKVAKGAALQLTKRSKNSEDEEGPDK